MSQAGNQGDLKIFLDHGRQIRLVNDLGSGKLVGIAFKNPGDWDWQVVRVEGTEGRFFRETATNLITKELAQAVPGISPPTSLDDALNMAEAILSPKFILGKIANAGAQAAAYHVGLPHIAPALGKVTEQFVASLPSRDSIATKVLNGASGLVVTCDLKDGHLTATVRDFAADKIDNIINEHTAGITPRDLRDIRDSFEPKHDAVPPAPRCSSTRTEYELKALHDRDDQDVHSPQVDQPEPSSPAQDDGVNRLEPKTPGTGPARGLSP